MTPDERSRLQVEINAAVSGPADAMGEGQPHRKAKSRTLDALGLYFRTIGRAIYLAEELTVLYPGEKPFAPDILAVLDVETTEDDERMSWAVVDEGKGPDLVIEVLYRGDRTKDLVENVERYARLGISEYFIYDRGLQKLHGYRLPDPTATRYQRMVPQHGHFHSAVLGLELAILQNTLRFLSGSATLPFSADLISRLEDMVESLETKADQAQAQADQAQAQAEQAVAGLQEALFTILELRSIPCPDEARAHIASTSDPALLRRWLSQAKTATTVEQALSSSPQATS
jgi:Uma2 family endonuclease